MHTRVASSARTARHATLSLMARTLSPMCGLAQVLTFISRGRYEPRFIVAGAELTGVHVLRGLPQPNPGSYHIGGAGVFRDEALIRSLAETIERYSQFIAELASPRPLAFASYNELRRRGEDLVSLPSLASFTDADYSLPDFPFHRFDPDAPLGWVRASSLIRGRDAFVPAQLFLVGYVVKVDRGERWHWPGVTTGSAAHTDPKKAVLNAMLEVVQIDAAMGHWFSGATAPRVLLDARTRAVGRLIAKHFPAIGPQPEFYSIRSPDLPGHTVACILRARGGSIPNLAIGLGNDLRLVTSMYKSLLEAVGTFQLAKVALLNEGFSVGAREVGEAIDPRTIYDLDRNVAFYALGRNQALIDSKFVAQDTISASELPRDVARGVEGDVAHVLTRFQEAGKELFFADCTTADIEALGFRAVRVWCPDTLSLCLPSFPYTNHPRFRSFGGRSHGHPHPYP